MDGKFLETAIKRMIALRTRESSFYALTQRFFNAFTTFSLDYCVSYYLFIFFCSTFKHLLEFLNFSLNWLFFISKVRFKFSELEKLILCSLRLDISYCYAIKQNLTERNDDEMETKNSCLWRGIKGNYELFHTQIIKWKLVSFLFQASLFLNFHYTYVCFSQCIIFALFFTCFILIVQNFSFLANYKNLSGKRE